MDDEKTFELLNRGDTIGVFQVESKGMRDLLRRIGLTRFEDLIAMIALARSGAAALTDLQRQALKAAWPGTRG